MKRILLAALAMILIGCQSPMYWNYKEMDPDVNIKNEVTVGSPVFTWEYGQKYGSAANAAARSSGYHMELIYTGISQNIAHLLYREYYLYDRSSANTGSRIVRAPYSQEYQYDLNLSKILTFQDVKIEVIEATNEKLAYIVLKSPKGFKSKFDARPISAPRKLNITLKDGTVITGDVISQEQNSFIEMKKADGKIIMIKWNDIADFKYVDQ